MGFSKGFATGWYPRPGKQEPQDLKDHASSMVCPMAMLQSKKDQDCPHEINVPFLDVLKENNDHYISIQDEEPSYKHVML